MCVRTGYTDTTATRNELNTKPTDRILFVNCFSCVALVVRTPQKSTVQITTLLADYRPVAQGTVEALS